ncbi:MAG: PEP-CTERM sorting domain-containing protein [Planctomycetaceae bacterium]
MAWGLVRVAAALLTATIVSMASGLRADIVTFEAVAVTGTPIPETSGLTFTRFAGTSISNGTVLFTGSDQVNVWGVYTSDGGTLSRLVDSTAPIPGGTGNFDLFSSPRTDGSSVVFVGDDLDTTQSGVYTVPFSGGAATRIADTSTSLPGGGSIDTYLSADVNGGTVAVEGFLNPAGEGIYTIVGGNVTTIVDTNTLAPGTTSNFDRFSSPQLAADGTVVFQGDTDQFSTTGFQGIYTGTGGALTTVVDSSDAMPNSTGTFSQIRPPSVSDDGTIAFGATGTETHPDAGNFSGVYTSLNGVLSVVADATTLTPDGTEFLLFDSALTPIWEDTVGFVAYDLLDADTLRQALWISRAGTLYEILTIATAQIGSPFVGEMFDGRQLELIFLSPDSIEGDTIAFTAAFTNGDWGVYTATIEPAAVPEPSSLLLLGLTGAACAGTGWRRRKSRPAQA